jgi:hypothetical protein
MINQTNADSETIDRKTSRSICDAVGERLQRDLRPDTSHLSSHLDYLMAELRKRDEDRLHDVEFASYCGIRAC